MTLQVFSFISLSKEIRGLAMLVLAKNVMTCFFFCSPTPEEGQPRWSAYRQPAFGQGLLTFINETHAHWQWNRSALLKAYTNQSYHWIAVTGSCRWWCWKGLSQAHPCDCLYGWRRNDSQPLFQTSGLTGCYGCNEIQALSLQFGAGIWMLQRPTTQTMCTSSETGRASTLPATALPWRPSFLPMQPAMSTSRPPTLLPPLPQLLCQRPLCQAKSAMWRQFLRQHSSWCFEDWRVEVLFTARAWLPVLLQHALLACNASTSSPVCPVNIATLEGRVRAILRVHVC